MAALNGPKLQRNTQDGKRTDTPTYSSCWMSMHPLSSHARCLRVTSVYCVCCESCLSSSALGTFHPISDNPHTHSFLTITHTYFHDKPEIFFKIRHHMYCIYYVPIFFLFNVSLMKVFEYCASKLGLLDESKKKAGS